MAGSEPLDEDPIIARAIAAVAEGLASELERHLLERLVGSSFVPTADGSVFVFKLGPACSRCEARTRTGPLRLLNVPGHWATENGFQRLRELPARGRYLRVAPRREQDLTQFLGKTAADIGTTSFFGPNSEVALCEGCAQEALRIGVLQERDQRAR